MSIQAKREQTDDLQFVELLDLLLGAIIRDFEPEEVWIIKIDNWFDHKWLNYSGKGVVDFPLPALGVGEYGALEPHWQGRLTFPPFPPSRVLSQEAYLREADGYKEVKLRLKPHPRRRQMSENNLQRRVRHFTRSGAFFWYSGNTAMNGRASVMVYTMHHRRTASWFAEFVKMKDWHLHQAKGISRGELLQLLNIETVANSADLR